MDVPGGRRGCAPVETPWSGRQGERSLDVDAAGVHVEDVQNLVCRVPDADYLAVFRVAGTTAFIAHGIAIIPESIWFGRPWPMTLKTLLDALIYGLLTGSVFGWLV